MIITGANAGGKTVSLKTLGLLTLMAQCGIPIPAKEGSEIAVFGKIFADIGDEQSLQDNLSTFSAWVQTISKILEEADQSSLVLMDEVGGGTDPTEGAALAMALIDGLRARRAKIVVTTHLHLLKAYGVTQPDVINVSVEMNPDTLRPTYRLIYGRPGESYALLMAEKWGLPHDLAERANSYLGEGDRKVGKLLQSLERAQQELENERQDYERLNQEAESARKEAEVLFKQAQQEKESLLAQARQEAMLLVRDAKEDLRLLINEFKAKGRTDVHRLGQEIRDQEEKIRHFPRPRVSESFQDGPRRSAGQGGKTSEKIPAFGQHEELPPLNAGKGNHAGSAAGARLIHYEIPSASRELKVIGLRVEEALPLVDKAIDEAFLSGLKELEVIHGAGTGRLRKMIREHLREHGCVKAFLPGGPGRGGDGVTVVEIGPAPAPAAGMRRSGKGKVGRY